MPNTYTQIYVQIVFAVMGRQNLIAEENRETVEKYLYGIVSAKKSKMLAVYCNPDHTHIFIGLNPDVSVAEMAKTLKANSSKYINKQRFISGKFSWQKGYGAFTYSRSQIDSVVKYILNQKQHHQKKSFKEEYLVFLRKFGIKYDEKYLFDWIE